MALAKSKFVVRKYDGDSAYSYAVFHKADLRGHKGIVFAGQARPIVCGCGKSEADGYKSRLEAGYYDSKNKAA